MNLKVDRTNFRQQLNDVITKYERDFQYNFSQTVKISFVPEQAFDNLNMRAMLCGEFAACRY